MDRSDIKLLNVLNELRNAVGDKDCLMIDALAMAEGVLNLTVRSTGLEFDDSCLDTIDCGLDFIGKAISEDRRFIRSTGEVVPIEKIKRVSKESVIHLSRHSDLVKEVNGDEIVPDKLYSAERLNDYATYENRFLCTLLGMIKEFLDDKYDLISRGNTYDATLLLDKKASAMGQKLSVKIEMSFESENTSSPLLERIEQLRQRADFYLHTPLMAEAAKEDAVRTLTKTNVIRMDKNFSEAASIYEFLLAYKSDVTSTEQTRDITPSGEAMRQLFVPLLLESFVLRMIGSGGDYTEKCAAVSKEFFEESAAKIKAEGGTEKYIERLTARIDELDRDNARLIRALSDERSISSSAYIEEVERERDMLASALEAKKGDEEKLRAAEEKITVLEARINALRNVGDDELGSKDDLDELEREFFALGRLLFDRWQKIKTELKRQHMGELVKIMKGSKEDDNGR